MSSPPSPETASTDPKLPLLFAKMLASLVQGKEKVGESKKGIKQAKKESGPFDNPPPPPLSAHSGKCPAKQHETKQKFNGAVKNYKDGAKRQRTSRKIEVELEGAMAVDGPDVLLKLKTLGYAIIKDYDKLRVQVPTNLNPFSWKDINRRWNKQCFTKIFSQNQMGLSLTNHRSLIL